MPNLKTVGVGFGVTIGVSLCLAFWALIMAAVYLQQPGQDWMVFYIAGRAYLTGNLPVVWDGAGFMQAMNAQFGAWLSKPLTFHPWIYPPHFLLLFLPFAALPPRVSYLAFMSVTFALLLLALWSCVRRRDMFVRHAALMVLSPAAAYTVAVGQNAFLTSALLVGGCSLLNRRPIVAGMLFGVLTFKPQLCLMLPVALLAIGAWMALASAAVATGALVLVTLVVFGPDTWIHSVDFLLGRSPFYPEWVTVSRLTGTSVYACAGNLGATPLVANGLQAAACGVAAVAVWVAFRRPLDERLRLVVLLAATLLAAPHSASYDFILLTIAAALAAQHAIEQGGRPGLVLIAALAWFSPMINPPDLIRWSALTPLLVCGFIAMVFAAEYPAFSAFRFMRRKHQPLVA
jgi:hypothetical protein